MPRSSSSLAEVGVVIPLRSFSRGKSRLAGALDTVAHEAFVRGLADGVADAAAPHPTVVITSAPEVIEWAGERGLSVVADRGSLDRAADDGRVWAAEHGCTRMVVVHADLPDIVSLDAVTADAGDAIAVLVPCHRDDGTPVMSIPVRAVADHPPFEFSYGPGSFARHRVAARRAGLEVRVVRDDALAFDVDGPDDLAIVLARRRVAPER